MKKKILKITSIIILILLIILITLQLTGIWVKSIKIFNPLLAVLMIIQTIDNWKKDRSNAYLSLGATIFIIIVSIFIIFK